MMAEHRVSGVQKNADLCFVCGDHNPYGLNARFYDLENGEVVAVFTAKKGASELSWPGSWRRHCCNLG